MKIYFAGSIRGGRNDIQIYQEIINFIGNFGTVLTEHVGDPLLTNESEKENLEYFIYNRDLAWLKEADCVVAEVTSPSLGVGYEIAKSEEWNKPTLCLFRDTSERKLSAMIAGNEKMNIGRYRTLEEAKKLIENFFLNIQNPKNPLIL